LLTQGSRTKNNQFFHSNFFFRLNKKKLPMSEIVPVIDFSLPFDQLSKELHETCKNVGFFYLINHGISEKMMETVFSESKRFIDLSEYIKKKYLPNKFNRGYGPFQEEKLDAQQNGGDTKEGFYIGKEQTENEGNSPVSGPNVWPSETGSEWKENMLEYHSEM